MDDSAVFTVERAVSASAVEKAVAPLDRGGALTVFDEVMSRFKPANRTFLKMARCILLANSFGLEKMRHYVHETIAPVDDEVDCHWALYRKVIRSRLDLETPAAVLAG